MTPDPPRLPRVRFGADYRAANPYQSLLYRAAGQAVEARPATPAEALAEALADPDPSTLIYHLHWEEHALRVADEAVARDRAQALLDDLERLRAAGCHLVWTRHNLSPHDRARAALHAEMTPGLTALASVVHLHSWPALAAVAAREPVDPARTVVIGHGNYVGAYAEWPAPVARDRLALPADAHVLLLFGRLGAYKQATRAARAFAATDAPAARLLVVGDAPEGEPELPGDPRIARVAGFVPDDEVGLYFAATDTVLLPYSDSLTSGAALLAASLGRAVLGPDAAGLRDLVVPGRNGSLYDPDDPAGLERALPAALAEGREAWRARGTAAQAAALARDWAIPGRQWRDLFFGLAAPSPRGRVASGRLGPA